MIHILEQKSTHFFSEAQQTDETLLKCSVSKRRGTHYNRDAKDREIDCHPCKKGVAMTAQAKTKVQQGIEAERRAKVSALAQDMLEQIWTNLRLRRKDLGMTIQAMSDVIGVNQSQYGRWEKGRGMTLQTFVEVALHQGVHPADLLRYHEETEAQKLLEQIYQLSDERQERMKMFLEDMLKADAAEQQQTDLEALHQMLNLYTKDSATFQGILAKASDESKDK
jgi:transcriptional regulator with XRE-family HTH domain